MTDMNGRICLVTGASRGIGRAAAEGLAKLGATVVVHGRDSVAVGAVCREIAKQTGRPSATGVVGDFSRLADVRRVAAELLERHARLDVLVNNAGTSATRRTPTADGFEWQFGVNHLAPFLLTNLLLERLRASAPARIVNVSSAAHRRGVLDLDDPNWERRPYNGLAAYGASKLANILFTRELARRLEGSGVTASCLHPGLVATNIFASWGLGGKIFALLARPWMLSQAAGAKTTLYLATSPEVATASGGYFDKCAPAQATSAADDRDAARRLWEISARMTGLA
jgi:NAD(P)-dependent dehydrogenase (short-subunit alcohol dehydrogenase family)